MKRRQLLGLAGSVGAGSLAVGTGAFNFVNVDRDVSINVVADDSAFLRLEAIQDSGLNGDATLRSVDSGRKVFFQIPGTGPGENDDAEGVGTDSVYEFDKLVKVTNQGTQELDVYSKYEGTAFETIGLTDGSSLLTESNAYTLGVGKAFAAGIYIDSHGTDLGDYDETLSIIGEATDSEQ